MLGHLSHLSQILSWGWGHLVALETLRGLQILLVPLRSLDLVGGLTWGPLCVPGLAWRPYLNSRRIKGANNKNVGEAGLSLSIWAPACPGQTICVLIPGHLLKRKSLTPPGFPVSGRFWSQRGEKDDAFKSHVLQRLMGASKPVAHGVQLSPANSPDQP